MITERLLRDDIVEAFDAHELDVLCLSELGELGQGIGSKLPGHDVDAWIRELLSDSAVPPVSVYSDGHYATLVKTRRVLVEEYKVVGGFVSGQEERCFQPASSPLKHEESPAKAAKCRALGRHPTAAPVPEFR